MRFSLAPITPLVLGASFLLAACGGGADTASDTAADSAAADAAVIEEAAPAMDMLISSLSGAAERPDPVGTKAQAEATYMVYPTASATWSTRSISSAPRPCTSIAAVRKKPAR
jgi:hypothetical protein